MSATLILVVFFGYFLLLCLFSWFTSEEGDNDAFFIGQRKSPWYLVAFGMVGASLSGVTYLSVPGVVGKLESANGHFSYLQMVLGNIVGYIAIAMLLMPVYYKLKLTSIYGYLDERFGNVSLKTGAGFFILSRTIGASFRLFLVALILQTFVFDTMGVGFPVTILVILAMIWVYTLRGGIKTIVWTDPLQTIFMLVAVGAAFYYIANDMGMGVGETISFIQESKYAKVFFFEDWSKGSYFWKQFLGGAAIAFAMVGLDQDMMQKHNSCPNIGDARKNMFSFAAVFLLANIVFVSLGALLYLYAASKGFELPLTPDGKVKTDAVFASIALNKFGIGMGVIFLIGLIAAAFSSADSALTSLTTSFCVDILDFEKGDKDPKALKKTRFIVHLAFSGLLFFVILSFKYLMEGDTVSNLFRVAGYTYGPLLGLFVFGLFTKWDVKDELVLPVCLAAPVLTYIINANSVAWLNGYKFGFELLLINGWLTFVGLLLIRQSNKSLTAT